MARTITSLDSMRKTPVSLINRIIPILVLTLLLIMSVVAYFFTLESIEKEHQLRFDAKVDEVYRLIETQFKDCGQILQGAGGLFFASQHVDRAEWKKYVAQLDVSNNYPGILGVAFGKYVRLGEKQEFEQLVQSEGFSDFKIYPPGDRSEYVPVYYIEPFDGRNKLAFGYDMYNENHRQVAIDRAIHLNTIAMTKRVVLRQMEGQDKMGFIIYHPIFTNDQQVDSLELRKQHIQGLVYIPVVVDEFINNILESRLRNSDLRIRIYDEAIENKEGIIFDNQKSDQDSEYYAQRVLPVYGHQWKLSFYQSSDEQQEWLPWIILSAGILVSFLVYWLLFSFQQLRVRAQDLASLMTQDLKKSHDQLQQNLRSLQHKEEQIKENSAKMRLIINNLPEALFITDSAGKIIDINPAAERMFQKPKDQLLGEVIDNLILDVRFKDMYHNASSDEALDMSVLSIKVGNVEFILEAHLITFNVEGERTYILFLRDITQLKRIQDIERQRIATFERMNQLMVDREMRMVELKKQLQQLKDEQQSA